MVLRLSFRLAWLLLLLATGPAWASHLLGGELTYRYLDASGPAAAPHRYEITVTIYNNCGNAAIRVGANVGIYDVATGARVVLTTTNYPDTVTNLGQTGMMRILETSRSACLSTPIPPGCTVAGPSLPYVVQKFTGVLNLPAAAQGYYALFYDGTRNVDVVNLRNPDLQGMALYTVLAPAVLLNHSPVFSNLATAIVCAQDTTTLLNNAVDPDGDRLVYSFGQPYGDSASLGRRLPLTSFMPPPRLVPYVASGGYSATTPFGPAATNLASIDASTGIVRYGPAMQGKYAVSVDVREYRTIGGQDVLIGITRRDIQVAAVNCPPTPPPVLPPATTPRSYTVEAGGLLTVPITSTQASGHPLTLALSSVLLDGAGGYSASLNGDHGTLTPGNPAGTASVAGPSGTVTGTFSYAPGCGEARAAPYEIAYTVTDNGCGGKTVADLLRITVTKPSGPTVVSGDRTVCALNTVSSYAATGGTAPGVRWRVVGGTVVGSATANPVQVRWTTAGPGTLVASGVSQYGCLTDSVTTTVAVAPVSALTVTGTLAICQGSSTTLAVAGGSIYTVTGGAPPLSGPGPFTLSPTQNTTYLITGLATATGCSATAQVTVTVAPRPAANAGPATQTACSGVPLTLGGAPVAGNSYSWSPTIGLSSNAAANPTLTLANPTSAPLTQTYTLTETTPAGCQATGTVAVTISPVLLPGTIGSGQRLCAGTAAAALSSLSAASGGAAAPTYQWEASPDNQTWTALAGATAAGYAPGTLAATTYFRRRATGGSCAPAWSNVVAVEVLPVLPASVALAAPPVQCPGTALSFAPAYTNVGSAPTYRWLLNGAVVATTATYGSSTLTDGDQVQVEVTPTAGTCTTGGPATATVVVRLTPAALPTVSIRVQTTFPACAGDAVSFALDQQANQGASPRYQWLLDGVAVAGATGTTFSSSTLRDGQLVRLLLSTTTACGPRTATSAAVRASITPPLVVSAGPDQTILQGEHVTLAGTANGTYPAAWTPATGLSFAAGNPLQPVAAPQATTVYTLTVRSGTCTAQSSVTVTVLPPVTIPNAFSPNGDGRDDTWTITHIEKFSGNKVLVFNRWGNKIFEASNYRPGNEWDGTIGGQPAPVGTYYYVVSLDNRRSLSGALTIVY